MSDTVALVIPARVYTDDGALDIPFDAQPWFACTEPDAIRALAACGWGGDYAADVVASTSRPQRELREVGRYRKTLIQARSAGANRLQKVLEGANVKLGSVLSSYP